MKWVWEGVVSGMKWVGILILIILAGSVMSDDIMTIVISGFVLLFIGWAAIHILRGVFRFIFGPPTVK
ncbi:MAG: hypothetical protein KAS32_23290 [Candidatus Peribacteraceae bacterium]|nr:hypothetical protein [Candidatus Peribacteraceae bacterium]